MDGPWYECEGPTSEEVKDIVLKKTFNKELFEKSDENEYLHKQIKIVLPGVNMEDVKYKDIFEKENYEEMCLKILDEEIQKIEPFGSWRGFGTFVEKPLYENYMRRVLCEVGEIKKSI